MVKQFQWGRNGFDTMVKLLLHAQVGRRACIKIDHISNGESQMKAAA